MKIKRFGALLLSAVLCIGMAAPAFAYEGDSTPVEQPVLPEIVEEEDTVTITDEESGALTPEGNLTLVDDYYTNYSDGSGQQFITMVSKSGATFYLVIDRNAKGQQTVHFMNLVDETDLLALMDEDAADAYTAEKEAAAKAEQERKQAEEDAKKAAEEAAASGTEDMNNMNCVSTMPEIMPEITDEAIIEALFAQRPYEEKVINSAYLEIPAEYQRKLNIPNVEKMSAEFTELIANPPKVSYRDGHYYVFDGQHTIVTRRAMNGGADLPIICKVYTGLTEEEEAILFSKQTGVSTPLTAGAELRAALVGKDAESIAFLNATESTGLQLGLDNYRAPWKIICIRTAFKEYKTYGADLYKEALTMLARGWEGDPDSLRSGILRGMVRFVALYQGEYDPERLVKRLHTVHPMTLVRDEKSLSGTVSYKYMMLILRTYNGSSRRFNLPIKQ